VGASRSADVVQVTHDEDSANANEKYQGGEGQGRAEEDLLEAIQLPADKGHGDRLWSALA